MQIFFMNFLRNFVQCSVHVLVLCLNVKVNPENLLIGEVMGKTIYHGHGLFLQFFGFFRRLKDLFTSAYYAGNQAVKQEASL